MASNLVKIRDFLLKDTDTLHEDIEVLLRLYVGKYPDKLVSLLQLQSDLAVASLKAKDTKANALHRALGYSVPHMPGSKEWKRLKPRQRAVHGALIFKPLVPTGVPTFHSQGEVDAFNAFRDALVEVADTLVDSDWAVEIVPGMNEWLKLVLEG